MKFNLICNQKKSNSIFHFQLYANKIDTKLRYLDRIFISKFSVRAIYNNYSAFFIKMVKTSIKASELCKCFLLERNCYETFPIIVRSFVRK